MHALYISKNQGGDQDHEFDMSSCMTPHLVTIINDGFAFLIYLLSWCLIGMI